jgi:hypothetical protein
METGRGQVTQLLKVMRGGDPQAAEALLPLVYSVTARFTKYPFRLTTKPTVTTKPSVRRSPSSAPVIEVSLHRICPTRK